MYPPFVFAPVCGFFGFQRRLFSKRCCSAFSSMPSPSLFLSPILFPTNILASSLPVFSSLAALLTIVSIVWLPFGFFATLFCCGENVTATYFISTRHIVFRFPCMFTILLGSYFFSVTCHNLLVHSLLLQNVASCRSFKFRSCLTYCWQNVELCYWFVSFRFVLL